MEERRNERNEGKRWEKVASKRPSLRHVVEEYGLKVRVFREKLLEIKIVQSKCQPQGALLGGGGLAQY